MVAVRGAHLKENETFELAEWIDSLEQDKPTSKKTDRSLPALSGISGVP